MPWTGITDSTHVPGAHEFNEPRVCPENVYNSVHEWLNRLKGSIELRRSRLCHRKSPLPIYYTSCWSSHYTVHGALYRFTRTSTNNRLVFLPPRILRLLCIWCCGDVVLKPHKHHYRISSSNSSSIQLYLCGYLFIRPLLLSPNYYHSLHRYCLSIIWPCPVNRILS